MHLVWNWNDSWKWISMQASAAVVVLNSFALAFPAEWGKTIHISSAVLGAAAMFGRLIQQTPPGPGEPDRVIHVQAGETVGVKGPDPTPTKETP